MQTKRENHTHNNAKSSKLGVLKKNPLKSKEKYASIEKGMQERSGKKFVMMRFWREPVKGSTKLREIM